MEKLIGVILDDGLLYWQEEALLSMEKNGYKIVIVNLKTKINNSSAWLNLIFFLEAKILGSSNKYLQHYKTANISKREKYSLNQIQDISTLPLDFKNLNYLVSFIKLDEKVAADLSVSLAIPILQLNTPDNKNDLSLTECVVSDYKQGKAVLEINLYQFANGIKSIQYNSFSSIEKGMLLKTINSVLAKCSLIIPRFLENKSNSGNVIFENGYTINLPHQHKRNLLRTLLYHLFDKGYYKPQWILLYQFQKTSNFSLINSFKPLLPPKNRFWADPFVVNYQSRNYISYC